MNYCLDISAVPYGTGVGRYTANLAKALRQLVQPPDTFSVFGTSLRQFNTLTNFTKTIRPQQKYLYPLPPSIITSIFHQSNLTIDSFIGNSAVFHSWDWYLPKSKKTQVVITIHDLAMFKFPSIAHPDIKAHHQAVIDRILQYKPQIIAVSQTTKNDLIELFNIDPKTITVIYEALPLELNPDIASPIPNQTPYFLMVGTTEPRKNYLRQIEAWRKYKKSFNLVIVGKDGWEDIPEETGIIRLKQVDSKTLAGLYHQASLLLYCSLYEGFGLPILEGLSYSIPVVTSNCSSMNEIAPAFTFQADPLDVESIITQIQAALSSPKSGGAKFVKDTYSWSKAAQETLEVYKKAAIT